MGDDTGYATIEKKKDTSWSLSQAIEILKGNDKAKERTEVGDIVAAARSNLRKKRKENDDENSDNSSDNNAGDSDDSDDDESMNIDEEVIKGKSMDGDLLRDRQKNANIANEKK